MPVSGRIDLGTENTVRLGLFATSTTPNTQVRGVTLHNFMESIRSLTPQDFVLTQTGAYDPSISFTTHYPNPAFIFGGMSTFTAEQV